MERKQLSSNPANQANLANPPKPAWLSEIYTFSCVLDCPFSSFLGSKLEKGQRAVLTSLHFLPKMKTSASINSSPLFERKICEQLPINYGATIWSAWHTCLEFTFVLCHSRNPDIANCLLLKSFTGWRKVYWRNCCDVMSSKGMQDESFECF